MKWQQVKCDAGYGAITWPEEFGGAGLPAVYEEVFVEEEAGFDVPVQHETFSVTVRLVAPTIRRLGTERQRERFVPRFLRAEELCCQLFSEPNAGSDLASLGTRAVRDGDGWVVNGQKVWSSGAQFSAWGELIARADPDVPKARRPHRIHRSARLSGRGDPPHPADERRVVVQRGLPQRCQGARRSSAGRCRRRLEGGVDDPLVPSGQVAAEVRSAAAGPKFWLWPKWLDRTDEPVVRYDRPCDSFVAEFIGSPAMNLRLGTLAPGGVVLVGGVTLPVDKKVVEAAAGLKSITLGIRPEAFTVSSCGSGLAMQVKLVEASRAVWTL